MNIEHVNEKTAQGIESNTNAVGFAVHNGSYYWFIDWHEHFRMDQVKFVDALLQEPMVRDIHLKDRDIDAWRQERIANARNGLTQLTKENFLQYLDGPGVRVVSTDVLRDFFWDEDEGSYLELSHAMEKYISFEDPLTEEMEDLREIVRARLPKFYLNFDRKLFMHTFTGKNHHEMAPEDWWQEEFDFEVMIPTRFRYWEKGTNIDLWTATYFVDED